MGQKSKSKSASRNAPNHEHQHVKIKSTVVSPPEPTAHPKDYESIEY